MSGCIFPSFTTVQKHKLALILINWRQKNTAASQHDYSSRRFRWKGSNISLPQPGHKIHITKKDSGYGGRKKGAKNNRNTPESAARPLNLDVLHIPLLSSGLSLTWKHHQTIRSFLFVFFSGHQVPWMVFQARNTYCFSQENMVKKRRCKLPSAYPLWFYSVMLTNSS